MSQKHIDAIKSCTRKFDRLSFPSLAALARDTFKTTLSIYDLETTNFRNTWNFGITEMAMLSINPDGSMHLFSSLFNPGYPITPIVVQKTGITDEMVKSAPCWKDLGVPLFDYLSKKGNYLIGYNNRSFDRLCVADSNAACLSTVSLVSDDKELDLYPAATRYFGRRVKLSDAAVRLGLDTSCLGSDFHRASADVLATAFTADRLVGFLGREVFLTCARGKKPAQKESLQRELFEKNNQWAF